MLKYYIDTEEPAITISIVSFNSARKKEILKVGRKVERNCGMIKFVFSRLARRNCRRYSEICMYPLHAQFKAAARITLHYYKLVAPL